MDSSSLSDNRCNMSDFPRITTSILEAHKDEVWNVKWSHDGTYLASASKDKSVIIWRRGSPLSSPQDWAAHHILRDHRYWVTCLAWSLDDTILLTGSGHIIKLWNTETGVCIRTLDDHTEFVTALSWLPDGLGFISGGLDRKIIIWDADGSVRDAWGATAIRITELALTPDSKYLVAVGMEEESQPDIPPATEETHSDENAERVGIIVFDFETKQTESSTRLEGQLTSMQITQDSRYALMNHSPNEILLWDIHAGRMECKYSGQSQLRHVIRSCFGGVDRSLVASGSEDGKVYIWHSETGVLLEALTGHGEGSVNAVDWNPTNERMFASCSDDHSIRIWEPAVEATHDGPSTSASAR